MTLNTNRLRQHLLPPETFAAGVGACSSRRTIPAALSSIVVQGNQQATGKHQAHRDYALSCRSPLFPTVRGVPVEVCNLGGLLARWSVFHALLKVCQDAKRGIAKSFKAFLRAGVVHGGNHAREGFPDERRTGSRDAKSTARGGNVPS